MNEPGYSVNGGTGSARDYYYDNSHGAFEPVFDVYGPVQLDKPYSYYGENYWNGDDKRPEEAIIDGCKKLDADIDFSRYDNDGDGKVDLVFMYYAGKGEPTVAPPTPSGRISGRSARPERAWNWTAWPSIPMPAPMK